MDQNFTNRIKTFLALESPTDEQVREAAVMLLQCDPARERAIYNTAQRRPQAMLPWIRTDLRKYAGIRERGLERHDVPEYNRKAVSQVRESLSVRPVTVEPEKTPLVSVSSVRGKRQDHDSLPESIKDLWDKNTVRWKKIRQLHAQLMSMVSSPGYQACDGNEICHTLLEADTAMRNDYERYDKYDASGNSTADDIKATNAARTTISRALQRKSNSEKQIEDTQDAVNLLFRVGANMKQTTIEKLRALGISIPDAKR